MIFLNYPVSNFQTVFTVIFGKSFLLSINKCMYGTKLLWEARNEIEFLNSYLPETCKQQWSYVSGFAYVIQRFDASLCYKNTKKYNYVATFNQNS